MRKLLGVLLLIVAVVAVGCGVGKPAADAAVQTAQTAFDAAKDQAMKIAPDQAKSIQDAIDAAKASAEKGDYKAAIEAAKPIPAQVKAMADGLAAKQKELQASWDSMKDMGGMVDQFKSKVESLAKMKHLPAGLDATKLDAAKTALADVTSKWSDAQAAVQAGNWADAVAKGGEVKTALQSGMEAIGMTMPSTPAPTAAK